MNANAGLGAGVIGYGYWGPNLARNIANCSRMELRAIAETRTNRRSEAVRTHPAAAVVASHRELLEDPGISLIVIATPPATHFGLASEALAAGKHVLIEKPFTTSEAEAKHLVELAERQGLHVLVDHTFLFAGAVRKIQEYAPSMGDLQYYDATRTNLGTFQTGTDVLWDLAPHDLSILLSLVDSPIELVAAIGAAHGPGRGLSMAYLTLRFAGGPLAHIHINWMAPAKVRRTIIGGTKRMLVYDDIETSEKLKVYETASDPGDEDMLRRMVDYRVGDVISPRLDQAEALQTEVEHVARVILDGEAPISDARLGLRVVQVIEAAHRSLANDGIPVTGAF